ncbi:ferritin-like domain-containing protein [Flavobacterium sp. 102]|uniref:YciE/YciF ferroxidase family protein n=1 Tax=Flavobacterium sp. 102 TaxID=2135623 RepID=UPI000EB54A0B|nr:ferritin-like domain-containing protein [Flavobacterium sp. 102]RKS02788.1 ferritin-like metal-binding protein YciE [Flavobacterium sp. 102]
MKDTLKTTKQKQAHPPMKSSQLMKLFVDELKDIYWAEKALTKAIPTMIQNASSLELIEALTNHLEETHNHVERVRQIFEILGKKPETKPCKAMQGLIEEAGEIMKSCEEGPMRDAGIISAAQKVEHYEMATYGTLRQFGETLNLTRVVVLLAATLQEEKAADEKLSTVAIGAVNVEAASEAI